MATPPSSTRFALAPRLLSRCAVCIALTTMNNFYSTKKKKGGYTSPKKKRALLKHGAAESAGWAVGRAVGRSGGRLGGRAGGRDATELRLRVADASQQQQQPDWPETKAPQAPAVLDAPATPTPEAQQQGDYTPATKPIEVLLVPSNPPPSPTHRPHRLCPALTDDAKNNDSVQATRRHRARREQPPNPSPGPFAGS